MIINQRNLIRYKYYKYLLSKYLILTIIVNIKMKKHTEINKHGRFNRDKPTVSIVTPTYNRRKFIPFLINCVKKQTYPMELMEWVIVDDGEDCVEDLFKVVDFIEIKYFYQKERMLLGAKRNYIHSLVTHDIIIYMDDDDYYPPERVQHSVKSLMTVPQIKIAGCSESFVYFVASGEIWRFGPYKKNHSTAGSFSFWRELLKETSYDDEAVQAEEMRFLKNYTIPLMQLNARKTILVLAHKSNTFDKTILLTNPHPNYVKKTNLTLDYFIKDKQQLQDFNYLIDDIQKL